MSLKDTCLGVGNITWINWVFIGILIWIIIYNWKIESHEYLLIVLYFVKELPGIYLILDETFSQAVNAFYLISKW